MAAESFEIKIHGAEEVEAAAKRATAAVNEFAAALERLRVVLNEQGEAPEEEPGPCP